MEPLNIDDLKLIHRYIDNQLEEEEVSMLEERMKSDGAFRKIVLDHQNTRVLTDTYGERLMFENFKHFELEPHPVRPLWRKALIGVAALLACVFILGIAYETFFFSTNLAPDQLAESYFNNSPKPSTTTLGGDSDEIWIQVQDAFNADSPDYKMVINLVERHQDSLKIEAKLLQGYSYFQLEDYNNAIDAYESIPQNTVVAQKAQWWLSLSYLRVSRMDQALPILKGIANEDGPFRADAADLLEKLGEIDG